MARPLRIEFAGALYHITSRGNARIDIYLTNDDRQQFLVLLQEIVSQIKGDATLYLAGLEHKGGSGL